MAVNQFCLTAEFRRVRRRVTQRNILGATLRLPLRTSAVISCGYKKILVGGLIISASSHSLLG